MPCCCSAPATAFPDGSAAVMPPVSANGAAPRRARLAAGCCPSPLPPLAAADGSSRRGRRAEGRSPAPGTCCNACCWPSAGCSLATAGCAAGCQPGGGSGTGARPLTCPAAGCCCAGQPPGGSGGITVPRARGCSAWDPAGEPPSPARCRGLAGEAVDCTARLRRYASRMDGPPLRTDAAAAGLADSRCSANT